MTVEAIELGAKVIFEDGVMAERISANLYSCLFDNPIPSGMVLFASLIEDDLCYYLVPKDTHCKSYKRNGRKKF